MRDADLLAQGIKGEPRGQTRLPNAVPDHDALNRGLKDLYFN
jgi:hypothetical protein